MKDIGVRPCAMVDELKEKDLQRLSRRGRSIHRDTPPSRDDNLILSPHDYNQLAPDLSLSWTAPGGDN
jgi:hypothetical protein